MIAVVLHLLATRHEHDAFALEVRLDKTPKHIELLRQLPKAIKITTRIGND
jgi:hypothetical protein